MMLSPAPHLHRPLNGLREDSCIEPAAFRAARWPPLHAPLHRVTSHVSQVSRRSRSSGSPAPTSEQCPATSTASPPVSTLNPSTLTPRRSSSQSRSPSRRFPRSYTAPEKAFKQSSYGSRPVQLSPGLTPLMRDTLPQPKPLRPRFMPPEHSDLSAASTRAENEPLAVRDLRRVTAPPSLMDRHHFPSSSSYHHPLHSSASGWGRLDHSSSFVSERDIIHWRRRDRYAAADKTKWPLPTLALSGTTCSEKRGPYCIPQDAYRPPNIPDRLHDSYSSRGFDEELPVVTKNHSITSGVSNDSDMADELEDGMGERFQERSLSETVVKRKTSFLKNGKSMWDRLWKRRRCGRMDRTSSEGGISASRDGSAFGRGSRGMGETRRSGLLHRRSWLSDTFFGSKRDR